MTRLARPIKELEASAWSRIAMAVGDAPFATGIFDLVFYNICDLVDDATVWQESVETEIGWRLDETAT